jgi:hypothetical protein
MQHMTQKQSKAASNEATPAQLRMKNKPLFWQLQYFCQQIWLSPIVVWRVQVMISLVHGIVL